MQRLYNRSATLNNALFKMLPLKNTLFLTFLKTPNFCYLCQFPLTIISNSFKLQYAGNILLILYNNSLNLTILLSYLLQKSAQNYDVAKFLETQKKYSSSIVHSSYYSSFQIILHIIYNIEKKIKNEMHSQAKDEKKTYHEFCINFLFKELQLKEVEGKIDNRQISMFYNDIVKLKKLRNDADYEDSEVSVIDMDKSMLYSININGILKKTYNL